MPILCIDLPIDQGADATFPIPWLAGGTSIDFTGASARLQARIQKSDTAPIASVSTVPSAQGWIQLVSGVPSVPALPAVVVIRLLGPATLLMVTDCLFDLPIRWADGTETEFASGRLRVRRAVTQ